MFPSYVTEPRRHGGKCGRYSFKHLFVMEACVYLLHILPRHLPFQNSKGRKMLRSEEFNLKFSSLRTRMGGQGALWAPDRMYDLSYK